MILVIGATGPTGPATLAGLLERGAPVRALATSPAEADELRALGAEVAVGDLDDPASLAGAMRGVERVYLAQPPGDRQLERELNAVAVAEQAGAYHLVKLGMLGQSAQSPLQPARVHAEVTATLQASSLRWTILEAGPFMQDVVSPSGVAADPDAPVSYVDARDVGAVAARVLGEEGHENCTYVLTGPEALTGRQVAATVAQVTGHGVPLVEGPAERDDSGAASAVTPDVEALLGRPPRALRAFAEELGR